MIRSSVNSGNLMQVILDHKKDPAYLLSVLSNVNPEDLNAVIVLVRALLAASEADLSALTQGATDANTAYDAATAVYDAAVLAETGLAGEKTALELQLSAKSIALEQKTADVAAALLGQTAAHGAKTNAQSTLESESVRLNGEIATLLQVIALLEGLAGSTGFYNDIDGGGWELVRRVKAGNTWHPAKDQCRGSEAYGTYVDDPTIDSTFSKRFDNINFNQFLFSTGDRAKWLVATKDAVLSGFYANSPREILMASDNPNVHTARWYLRSGSLEDPWLSLNDHGPAIGQGNIVYGENSYGGTHASAVLPQHNGANVFVRFKA